MPEETLELIKASAIRRMGEALKISRISKGEDFIRLDFERDGFDPENVHKIATEYGNRALLYGKDEISIKIKMEKGDFLDEALRFIETIQNH